MGFQSRVSEGRRAKEKGECICPVVAIAMITHLVADEATLGCLHDLD